MEQLSEWLDEATVVDVGASGWAIDDEVIHLRRWGSDIAHLLPERETVIGSSPTCGLHLADPSGCTSRRHARLVRGETGWWARDLESKNGLWCDGERVGECRLEPGVELQIGGVTLVAESRRFVALRRFVARLLGWAPEHLVAIDIAIRSIRMAATRRLPLALVGEGDVVALAHDLHRRALGSAPFVVCDPRRRDGEENVRSASNVETGLAAMHAARGGSLCVWSRRLPADFAEVRLALRDPTTRVQLVVCAAERRDLRPYEIEPIAIPSMESRVHEIARIIDEYADEAAVVVRGEPLTPAARRWILQHSSRSLSEIDKGTRRMLAVREHADNIAAAARALGMAPISLSRWLGRRVPRS